MRTEDLEGLNKIARLVADRDVSELGILRAQAFELQAAADALGRQAGVAIGEGLDPASRAGADLLWDRWRTLELRRLQAKRAELAVREAEARARAQRSFGRQTALAELAAKMGGPRGR